MKRIWFVSGYEVTGSMVSTWDQSWGLSRDERSCRWILYDRRDDRNYETRAERSVGVWTYPFAKTWHLLDFLTSDGDGPRFTLSELIKCIEDYDEPAMKELLVEARARREAELKRR